VIEQGGHFLGTSYTGDADKEFNENNSATSPLELVPKKDSSNATENKIK
jgi:hypothetical protein